MAATEYVVLRRTRAAITPATNTATDQPMREQWEVVEQIAADSADAAVRKLANKAVEAGSSGSNGVLAPVLVAVPVRSWAPLRVTTETSVRVKIEPA